MGTNKFSPFHPIIYVRGFADTMALAPKPTPPGIKARLIITARRWNTEAKG